MKWKARIDKERSQDRKSKLVQEIDWENKNIPSFPQGRVTDHRINLFCISWRIFEGEIFDEVIESLTYAYTRRKVEIFKIWKLKRQ